MCERSRTRNVYVPGGIRVIGVPLASVSPMSKPSFVPTNAISVGFSAPPAKPARARPRATTEAANRIAGCGIRAYAGDTPATTKRHVRHIYVHIPFCARICPYCAFYKDLLDRSQTSRFCEAFLGELDSSEEGRAAGSGRRGAPIHTIVLRRFTWGDTPTALNIAQLELLLRGFQERLELSQLVEWTIEANPGSVSARKAALLKKFGVNRISLGVQSWDEELLKLLGREHNALQAEESFRILRDAGFGNINVDLMFGLPGQTDDQWRATLEKTIALQPKHISTYCLTYEEDTEFFLRHARGEFRQDADADAEFFEMTMAMLEDA